MNSKTYCNIFFRSFSSFLKQTGGASLLMIAISLILLNSCSKKSQEEEDLANLKLIGYKMDQPSLFNAVENDDLSVLKVFKSHEFDLLQANSEGRTALHVAAESGSVSTLSYLIQQGALIDVADINGLTPLMVAVRSGSNLNGGNSEVIKQLLEKGADAQKKDELNKFALIHALDGGSPEAIELLAAESRELLDTGLLYSADLNKYASIPVLVRYGASVYSRNSGKTGLMIAAERGNAEAVQALIDEGANLYAVSDDGMLASDFAEGDEEVLAVLLEAEREVGEDALALEWSDEELEALVQKAMERSPGDVNTAEVDATVSTVKREVTATNTSKENLASKVDVAVKRISGKSLPLELSDNKVVRKQVMMTAYAEKSLPMKVKALDEGRVEVYDLRMAAVQVKNEDLIVREGSKIGVTGLSVKQIRKKIVNNKLTGGQDKELVTLMVEDEVKGNTKELYAGYESQAAEALAVLKMNETGENLIVERDDEFFDLKGTPYKVVDVNDKEVIIENVTTGQLSLLPLMGMKR